MCAYARDFSDLIYVFTVFIILCHENLVSEPLLPSWSDRSVMLIRGCNGLRCISWGKSRPKMGVHCRTQGNIIIREMNVFVGSFICSSIRDNVLRHIRFPLTRRVCVLSIGWYRVYCYRNDVHYSIKFHQRLTMLKNEWGV